ncbi:hypothetical protein ABW21_db0201552 [Orbilia brochopaga]|nr:hypothetical protein ABW21_db0201552 [Drechslerella brochopaga]
MAPVYAGRVFNGVLYRERLSRDERRHEIIRIIFTYLVINAISVVLIALTLGPVLDPHRHKPVTTTKVGLIIFRIFSGIWSLATAFYNGVGSLFAIRWLRKKWKREDAQFEPVPVQVEDNKPQDNRDVEDNEVRPPRTGLYSAEAEAARSAQLFAQNNPYTAVRRMHSGAFAAARRSRRSSYPLEPYRTPANHASIAEEPDDEEGGWSDDRYDSSASEGRAEITFPNLPARSADGGSAPRLADSYPFARPAAMPITRLSRSPIAKPLNPTTSAGDAAKANKTENQNENQEKKKKSGKPLWRQKKENDEEGQDATTEGQTAAQGQETGLLKTPTKPKSAKLAPRVHNSPSASGPSAGESSSDMSDGSQSTGPLSPQRRRLIPRLSSQTPGPAVDPVEEWRRQRTATMERMVYHGTHRDQLAASGIMNNAIWSQVGDYMNEQLILEQQASQQQPPQNNSQESLDGSTEASSSAGAAPRRQRRNPGLSNERQSSLPPSPSQGPVRAGENQPAGPEATEAGNPVPVRGWRQSKWLRFLIAAGGLFFCIIVTIFPPFLAIGGDFIIHDYQFIHGCDKARWDIKLDASGLQPEKDNIYNRATFKDRLGRGFEKEFVMNLEGMATYGVGLDASLVKEHRGYVFYLSKQDLSKQPDGGENVKFPYPVIVAYDSFKHAFYAHGDIWRDLNNEAFFDESAFMNASMSIFPTEGIWLEKEEEDGYCGQPKRLLKNDFEQRIIWTLVDNRKDCTSLRVCASRRATRRQVVLAVGTILQRLTLSASCCAKWDEKDMPVGQDSWET